MQLGPEQPRDPAPGPSRPLPEAAHTLTPARAHPRVTARGLLVTTHASHACSSDPTAREPGPQAPPRAPANSLHTHPGQAHKPHE